MKHEIDVTEGLMEFSIGGEVYTVDPYLAVEIFDNKKKEKDGIPNHELPGLVSDIIGMMGVKLSVASASKIMSLIFEEISKEKKAEGDLNPQE
jgi:hypothetical protein